MINILQRPQKITMNETNMNFLNAKDQSQHFEQFLRYSSKLDESRSTNLIDIVPEFKDYV